MRRVQVLFLDGKEKQMSNVNKKITFINVNIKSSNVNIKLHISRKVFYREGYMREPSNFLCQHIQARYFLFDCCSVLSGRLHL